MLRRAVPLLLLALALAAPAAAERWTRSYALTGRPDIGIVAGDAQVVLVPSDRKDVALTLTTDGWTIGERGVRVAVETQGNRLRCEVREPHFGLTFGFHVVRRVRLEVEMPRDADLDVRSADGGVTAGPVRGRVHIRTSDGGIDADGLQGDVVLETSDGHIRATGLDGTLAASSGDGHVAVAGRFEQLDVHTGDGRIEVTALEGSRLAAGWRVHSGDGGVSLRLPGTLHASLDVSTGDGAIHIGLPLVTRGDYRRSRVTGELNGGGPLLSVSTADGGIRIDPL